MKKVSGIPVLVNRSIEYICRNNKKVPHTGERFFLECEDKLTSAKFEGETENFPGDDWPDCVIGCVDFPQIENFKPIDRMFKLPSNTTEYDCAKGNLIPHTGLNLTLTCLENGTFVPTDNGTILGLDELPKCVRPDTCRKPFFPTHENYALYDEDKVAYYWGEFIEVIKSVLDHLTQTFLSLPPGGTDTGKQNSSAQMAYICLSLSHLTAIGG